MEVQLFNLGLIDYQEALDLQTKLLNLRQKNIIKDTLLLLEHPSLLTIGKNGKRSNILVSDEFLKRKGIKVYNINRGGDITYHGPGQIVGYPIFDLNNYGKDIRKFVNNMEEVFIQLLKEEYKIKTGRDSEHIGVWVAKEKITALGFAIKRWVSMHGFAFNVNLDLEPFKWIYPCGIRDKGVTSLEQQLGKSLDIEEVRVQVIKYLSKVFKISINKKTKETLFTIIRGETDEKKKT